MTTPHDPTLEGAREGALRRVHNHTIDPTGPGDVCICGALVCPDTLAVVIYDGGSTYWHADGSTCFLHAESLTDARLAEESRPHGRLVGGPQRGHRRRSHRGRPPPSGHPLMGTWRQFDALETTGARAQAEASDFVERLKAIDACLAPEAGAVMDALMVLVDAMRQARRAAEAAVVAERGWRG